MGLDVRNELCAATSCELNYCVAERGLDAAGPLDGIRKGRRLAQAREVRGEPMQVEERGDVNVIAFLEDSWQMVQDTILREPPAPAFAGCSEQSRGDKYSPLGERRRD